MGITITKKQCEDIGSFFDLLKSESGVIEGFFLKPDGQKITEYFDEKQAFVQSVAAFNHHGFTCYAGIQPRKTALLKANRSATGADVTALRILAVDLDACKPIDEAGCKLKVNASNAEKQACLTAARNISVELTNGNMGYQHPVLMDSGSGCWLFMPIPEIKIHEGNRREVAFRLKTWGRRFKERFQREGVEIDESVFELHRLTKIPGTRVFSYPDEPDRPQRVGAFLSETSTHSDEKLKQDFLTMPVEIPEERKKPVDAFAGPYHNHERIFERCYLFKFLSEKGYSGVSMPHKVRLALSTFSLPLGDLENNLYFIRRIIGGSPDFSEAKTRHYLETNKWKSQPYGCGALRELVKQHFKDFDESHCQCSLPVTHDRFGNPRKPSPIRFAGIMPEDLPEIFSMLDFSGDPFQDSLKVKKFSEETLTNVDETTAKSFLESVRGELRMSKGAVNDLLRERRAMLAEDATQAQRLINLAQDAELFRTPNDQIFATVEVNGHRETWPVKSSGFRNWLKHRYYREAGKPPSSQSFQDVLGILEAKGQFEGPVHPVSIRIAGHSDCIYVDLANDKWEAIEITPSGWNIVKNCPVRFRRTRGMSPLPYPVQGQSIEVLKRYLNLSNEDDFTMIVSWLVAAMKPTGPYPVFVFSGEQGTAKSTISRIIKSLIDPSSSPLRTTPTEVRDFMIGANNNWILAFDNLSGLPTWASDAICRLATGGGFSTRELYSDDQEIIFNAMRGVILNGIEDIVTRHDLADRSIIVNLAPIPEDQRLTEKDLFLDFEDDAPGIMGALCDAVSCALRNINNVKLERLPRMADFAVWVTAAESALPWEKGTFMKAYQRNLKEVVELSLDSDTIAVTVRSLMEGRQAWEGTATDLLKTLEDHTDDKITKTRQWPKAPHILTGRLKRAATSLRAFGIEVETGIRTHGGRRGIKIRKVVEASVTSATGTNNSTQQPEPSEQNPATLCGGQSVTAASPDSDASPSFHELGDAPRKVPLEAPLEAPQPSRNNINSNQPLKQHDGRGDTGGAFHLTYSKGCEKYLRTEI